MDVTSRDGGIELLRARVETERRTSRSWLSCRVGFVRIEGIGSGMSDAPPPRDKRRALPAVLPPRLVTVATTQFAMTNDREQNMVTAEALVRMAARDGADIILLSELFDNLYFCQDQFEDLFSLAGTSDVCSNSFLRRFCRLSKELDVVLPISFFEKAGKAYFNSVAIFDGGKYLGVYRKSHIPDGPGYQEKFYFNPGDTGFHVFRTRYATIGVGICWDQWFPECARCLALQGAELLFYPTAIGSEPQDPTLNSRGHWTRCMQGHAGSNLVPVVCANRIGVENEITFYGGSFITDHLGEIVQQFPTPTIQTEVGFLKHTFDLTKIDVARSSWGVFRDRRPTLYSPITSLSDQDVGMPARIPVAQPVEEEGVAALASKPAEDGGYMPGEWDSHACVWMAWPYQWWRDDCGPAQRAVLDVAEAISRFEPVRMLVTTEQYCHALQRLQKVHDPEAAGGPAAEANIQLVLAEYDDIWLRDTGPTFIRAGNRVTSVSWRFNGWGNKIPELKHDDSVSYQIQAMEDRHGGYTCPAVLEGGSFHVDGEGTLITTEECVLHKNRECPEFKVRSKESMNKIFHDYLGVTKVIYLPYGVVEDVDTDGHVDNLAAFVSPGHVLLTFPESDSHPQYPRSLAALEVLSKATDAKGRALVVHKIPHPPVMYRQSDEAEMDNAVYTARVEQQQLAGSYVNFVMTGGGIVMPRFHVATDKRAKEVMAELFPDKEIVMVDGREILLGGGNFHCITQQQPQ